MKGSALAMEAVGLTENVTSRLLEWEDNKEWTFELKPSFVRSAAIELGLLNCYSMCINRIKSVFDNPYFSRVWTFQEMILGKDICMWAVSLDDISHMGEFSIWMDLATDAVDKALKLKLWIELWRVLKTTSVNSVLRVINEDIETLRTLKVLTEGIGTARIDIINGGSSWWRENVRGVSNIFAAISLRPRECERRADLFKGLLGIFSGLFSEQEIRVELEGADLETLSFAFFKQLSLKTGRAWTKLGIGSRDRDNWSWIPAVRSHGDVKTTDCFVGVVNLGRLKDNGLARTDATTGLIGNPRKYMKIQLGQGNGDFEIMFKGCNCGKKIKTGIFSKKQIATYDQPKDIVRDETGRTLVQFATILGYIIDPGYVNIITYREALLHNLQPYWKISDPAAKPLKW